MPPENNMKSGVPARFVSVVSRSCERERVDQASGKPLAHTRSYGNEIQTKAHSLTLAATRIQVQTRSHSLTLAATRMQVQTGSHSLTLAATQPAMRFQG